MSSSYPQAEALQLIDAYMWNGKDKNDIMEW
jgi:hypothetical protein